MKVGCERGIFVVALNMFLCIIFSLYFTFERIVHLATTLNTKMWRGKKY